MNATLKSANEHAQTALKWLSKKLCVHAILQVLFYPFPQQLLSCSNCEISIFVPIQ
jgi:hypothetical protein